MSSWVNCHYCITEPLILYTKEYLKFSTPTYHIFLIWFNFICPPFYLVHTKKIVFPMHQHIFSLSLFQQNIFFYPKKCLTLTSLLWLGNTGTVTISRRESFLSKTVPHYKICILNNHCHPKKCHKNKNCSNFQKHAMLFHMWRLTIFT